MIVNEISLVIQRKVECDKEGKAREKVITRMVNYLSF